MKKNKIDNIPQRNWKEGLSLVFDFWQRHKTLGITLFILTALSGAVAVTFPYILRLIVDGIRADIAQKKLFSYVLLLTGFGLLRAFADVVMPFLRGKTNERFQWEIRTDVFQKLLYKDYRFTNLFPSGDVIERLDHDLGELSWFACSGIFRFISALLLVLFTLLMMLRMNWILTLVTLLPASLGAFAWMKNGPKIYHWFMKWREKIAEVNNHLQSTFSSIKLVKAFVAEDRFAHLFRRRLNERIGVATQVARVETKIQTFYMAIGQVAILLILWMGGILVIKANLTLGEFVAFNAYLLMLLPPMFDIGNLIVSGKRASGAGKRIGRLIESDRKKPEEQKPSLALPASYGDLKLKNVSCSHNSHQVLKEINIVIPKGSKIGIAGTVGSGKSTLLRVILRLIEPDEGEITLNGCDIRKFDIISYRRLFGYAPQEPTLFSDTLKNNILLGRKVDEETLNKVVALTQLKSDVERFTNGLNEMLGERGTGLSGGQKARVAIARAILELPPFILLDDTTSSIDADTEQILFQHLFHELPDRTFIIVSHRLKILSACDYVYVMDQGKVVEEGKPEELMEKRGLYYRLYERQTLREELERL